MSTTVLGKVSMTPKGAWNASTSYAPLDVVSYGGSSFLARRANSNVTPTEGADWQMIAEKATVGNIEQTTGAATDKVMSQKAVTGEINKNFNLLLKTIGTPIEFNITGYLSGNGQYGANNFGKVSDFIDVTDYDKIVFYHLYGNHTESTIVAESIGIVCFYNSKKIFINSAYDYYGFSSDTVSIPANAKYVRLCRWNDGSRGDDNGTAFAYLSNAKIKTSVYSAESINKPFMFSGKKIQAFGDSITAGVTSPNLQAGTPYIKHFADHAGATLFNRAISGSTLSYDGSSELGSICKRLQAISPEDLIDFIIIAGGTNDFNQNRAIGAFLNTDDSTVCGALRNMCEYINTNLGGRTIIFITPIPYTQAYYDRNNKTNALGYTLDDYAEAIYKTATAYGHSVVNGNLLGMPTGKDEWANKMCDNTDGCHPSADGHKLYARSLAGKLL